MREGEGVGVGVWVGKAGRQEETEGGGVRGEGGGDIWEGKEAERDKKNDLWAMCSRSECKPTVYNLGEKNK